MWHGTDGSLLPGLGGNADLALAINDNNVIAGEATDKSGKTHAVRWNNGAIEDLGGFGGSFGAANDINNAGAIAGIAEDLAGQYHGFVWADEVMTDLGTASAVCAINEDGSVVGQQDQSATLWLNGEALDLNGLLAKDSGWQLVLARDINDSGQIVGMGMHNGAYRGFLLSPLSVGGDVPHAVPLPNPAWMGMATVPLAWLGARLIRRIRN